MPSKGVDYYSYIALPSTEIRFSGPKVGSTTSTSNNFSNSHLEIDSKNLPFTFTGTFQWDVIRNGATICTHKQEINSLTGNLENGDFTNLMNTPAIVGLDYTISYGFYNSGRGVAGLTKSDQAWVSIVPKLSDWMGTVAPTNSAAAKLPFSTFVLAAAHDAGMNTTDGIRLVTGGAALPILIAGLSVLLPVPGIASLLRSKAMDIMINLAMTQKDSFTSMLDNGVRYFDFRCAYLLPGIREIVSSKDDTLYHTHLVIPGARFDTFLSEIVTFLKAHPTEIVVVRTCADGIKVCEVPSADVITQFATAALQGSGIVLGDRNAFQKPVDALRASGTRLILVQNNPKYDSYSDGAYATLNASTIINSFTGMNGSAQKDRDFTVLQCQGTCTSITDVLVYAAATANKSNSPLMSTKARFDESTLPWIRANALHNLTADQNIIIMNDFIDGATTHTAFELSQTRFASKLLSASASAAITSIHLSSINVTKEAISAPIVTAQAQKTLVQQFEGVTLSQSQSAQVGASPQLGAQIGGSQSQSSQTGSAQVQPAPSGAAGGFLHPNALVIESAEFAKPSSESVGNTASSSSEAPGHQTPAPAHIELHAQSKSAVQQFFGSGFSSSQSAQVGASQPQWGQNSNSQSQAARSGSAQSRGVPSGAAGGFLHTFVVEPEELLATPSPNSTSSDAKSAEAQQEKAQGDLVEAQTNEALLKSVVDQHSVALDAKENVSDEEKSAMDVLKAAHEEAEATSKAQQEVLDLANKKAEAQAEK